MKLTKNNLEEFYHNAPQNKLCNIQIFESIFKILLKIDFSRVDVTKSIFDASDNQGKLFNYGLDDLYKNSSELPKGISYHIELFSKEDISVKVVYILWKDTVNSYLGNLGIHYEDDAVVNSEIEFLEFKKHLSMFFNSEITEELTYNKNRLKEHLYEFSLKGKSPVIYSSKRRFLISQAKNDKVIVKKYVPWIS